MLNIRQATIDDHKAIIQVSKQSKYTRDFTNHIFSGGAMYEKGWIRVITEVRGGRAEEPNEVIFGFTCVRHKVRQPETVLYFIGVHKDYRDEGVGSMLLEDLIKQTPHKIIALNVMRDNEDAFRFYMNHGFKITGDALNGMADHLELHL